MESCCNCPMTTTTRMPIANAHVQRRVVISNALNCSEDAACHIQRHVYHESLCFHCCISITCLVTSAASRFAQFKAFEVEGHALQAGLRTSHVIYLEYLGLGGQGSVELAKGFMRKLRQRKGLLDLQVQLHMSTCTTTTRCYEHTSKRTDPPSFCAVMRASRCVSKLVLACTRAGEEEQSRDCRQEGVKKR